MRVLLTGSSGWLGRFLAPRLRAAGHVAIGLDVVPGADTKVVGSVADRAMVEHTLSNHGIQAVVHAGALHKPDIARYPRSAFVDANVTGTLNLLEAAVAAGHDRFVFTSTENHAVSRLRPLWTVACRQTPSNLKPSRVAAARDLALSELHCQA